MEEFIKQEEKNDFLKEITLNRLEKFNSSSAQIIFIFQAQQGF